jgi:hypothetical protein
MTVPNMLPQSIKGALSSLLMALVKVGFVKVSLADFAARIELVGLLHYTSPFLENE